MGLDIRQCKWCRKPYQRTRADYCPLCQAKLDDAFMAIRDYLDEYPMANIHEVYESTGIEEELILQLLKEERLSFADGAPLTCEQCGAKIATGRYCGDCQKGIKRNVSDMLSGYETKAKKDTAQSMSTPDFHTKLTKF